MNASNFASEQMKRADELQRRIAAAKQEKEARERMAHRLQEITCSAWFQRAYRGKSLSVGVRFLW